MGLTNTDFCPLKHFPKEQLVPTVVQDFLRGQLQGYVHDEAAAFMGGVSGTAGLFTTVQDFALIYHRLLCRGG